MNLESKESIRRRLIKVREALTPAEVKRFSEQVCDWLLRPRLLEAVGTVALYAPVRNEVRTEALFERWTGEGKICLFPRVAGESIEFVEVEEWSALRPGRWGIPEPPAGRVAPVDEIDAVIVPAVAFDEKGYRLGFGGGYYDRTLAGFRGLKIGVAYDFQILKELPYSPGDLRCDGIFSNRRVIRVSR